MAAARKLVAVQLSGERFLRAWDELWAAGHAVLPLRPELPAPARDRLLAALRPHELWSADGVTALGDPAPVDARTDLVVATSGSTGPAKGVELPRDALEASARASLARLGAGAHDGWLCCLPLDHLAGLQVVTRARMAGAPLVLHERFDAERVAADLGQAAFVSLVPTMLTRLLDAGVDLRPLRGVLLGGAAPGEPLLRRAQEAGAPVVVTYGMTETAGGCAYDGVPLNGAEVRIDPVAADHLAAGRVTAGHLPAGRIHLRGPMLFHGYRQDAERTAEALRGGWFATADLGEWRDGRLVVLGRADDVIVTGGENVPAGDLAELLESHPEVREAAVLGVADERWGQAILAVIVPRDHSASPDAEALKAHVRMVAPAHWAPKRVLVIEALPRTPLGKVDHAALRELVRDQTAKA